MVCKVTYIKKSVGTHRLTPYITARALRPHNLDELDWQWEGWDGRPIRDMLNSASSFVGVINHPNPYEAGYFTAMMQINDEWTRQEPQLPPYHRLLFEADEELGYPVFFAAPTANEDAERDSFRYLRSILIEIATSLYWLRWWKKPWPWSEHLPLNDSIERILEELENFNPVTSMESRAQMHICIIADLHLAYSADTHDLVCRTVRALEKLFPDTGKGHLLFITKTGEHLPIFDMASDPSRVINL
ncbi:hypothetical protein F4677DRAFT_408085 [Hypoxylon crocopeplum]|nr:hypothetical protein F4677DRAFT_408085 [Hypoxylon crocopeplum]